MWVGMLVQSLAEEEEEPPLPAAAGLYASDFRSCSGSGCCGRYVGTSAGHTPTFAATASEHAPDQHRGSSNQAWRDEEQSDARYPRKNR